MRHGCPFEKGNVDSARCLPVWCGCCETTEGGDAGLLEEGGIGACDKSKYIRTVCYDTRKQFKRLSVIYV